MDQAHRDDGLQIGIPRPFVAQPGKAARDRAQWDPGACLDIRAHRRPFRPCRNGKTTGHPLDSFRQALVQPIGPIATRDFPKDGMRVFVKQNAAQRVRGMSRRSDVDPTIEETDRLERETMGMRSRVSRSPVEDDAQWFEGLDADRVGDLRPGFLQKAEHPCRVVARDFPEASIDFHPEMFATNQIESQRTLERVGVSEFTLVCNRGEPQRRGLSPARELGTGDFQEGLQVLLCAVETPTSPCEYRQIPMGFWATRIEAQHATQGRIGTCDLAAIEIRQRAAQ